MHELAVTENILNIVLKYAKDAQATKVSKIFLVIGDLSSIVDDSIQFYWDIIAKDTIAEGAQLCFTRITTTFECTKCKVRYSPDGESILCPTCGGADIRIISGEEFFLEAIDVEK
jgi:hydrogenase nickel incorporation protein HypA/HybF